MKGEASEEDENKERRQCRGGGASTSILCCERGEVEWRRVAYSVKVALALTLVSLSVLLREVSERIGNNALWAILTVVVVFEFTIGATLSKGLNRGLGTIMAASLGLMIDFFANFVGPKIEPYVVGCSIFFVGMLATYTRTNPAIKAKYDYGVVMFLLTFCLVVITGYRVSNNIDIVLERIVTITIGVIICLIVSIFVFPIWAGDDLHQLIIQNFESMADSLEECVKEYFQGVHQLSRISSKIYKGQPYDDKIYKGYRGVLISKQTQESLAMSASWEPRRGRFGCSYPWKKLVDVGAVLHHCAYTLSALHGCVLSEIQAPTSIKKVFARCGMRLGEEVARVLRQIAHDLHHGYKTQPKHILLRSVRYMVCDLKNIFINNTSLHDLVCVIPDDTCNRHDPQPNSGLYVNPTITQYTNELHESIAFAETLSVAGVMTLLIEVVARLDRLLDAVIEFQEQAGFYEFSMNDGGIDESNNASGVSMKICVHPRRVHISDNVDIVEHRQTPSSSTGE